jgi:phenylacetaldehyde dehydrogenase
MMDKVVQNYLEKFGVREETQRFLTRPQRMFIGGAWVAQGDRESCAVLEPSTAGVITHIPLGTTADLDRAVEAARKQFDGGPWRKLKPLERERLLHRLADLLEANAAELAEIESIDVGKSVVNARDVDIQGTIDTFRYFAGWASKLHGRTVEPSLPGDYVAYTRKEPIGVVGVIVPWNFPLQTMAWKVAAALAAGCTTVIKPAELTSLSTLRYAELVQEAMAAHPGIDKITFTGSTEVGRTVGHAAVGGIKRLTLELGGKSPVLVLEDADIEAAAQAVANGIFFNSGQVCDAGARVYIQRGIHDKFIGALIEHTRTMKIAPGLDRDCFISPLVSALQKDRVESYIEAGRREGAEVVHGGHVLDRLGYFVEPTIFAHCRSEMKIVREEIFGPVLVTAPFDDINDALSLANDSPYGLAAAVYSNDLNRVHRLIPALRAGTVYVNAHSTIDPSMPFGGFKESGFGKDLGPEQLDHLMESKAVWITLH